ncbi:MAG: TRAP transporter small permease [Alphaproteobacteria bacterium]|jgi:TRAP-type C4-dicarboxylate transport system permease small subunit|nr:TRAP transporter small permease [Alphaproteobacteria bacterium]
MDVFRESLRRVALVILLLGGIGTMAAMFLGTIEVVGTQMLKTPVPGALELTESTMVLIVFGALAYAQIRRGHIRVELIYTNMGPRVQAAMDVFANLAAMVFFGLLLWQSYHEAIYSLQIGEATVGLIRFPLFPARLILSVGTALLLLQLVLDMIVDIRRIRTGEAPPKIDPQNTIMTD